MPFRVKCEKCQAVGELEEYTEQCDCPECGGVMRPVTEPKTDMEAIKMDNNPEENQKSPVIPGIPVSKGTEQTENQDDGPGATKPVLSLPKSDEGQVAQPEGAGDSPEGEQKSEKKWPFGFLKKDKEGNEQPQGETPPVEEPAEENVEETQKSIGIAPFTQPSENQVGEEQKFEDIPQTEEPMEVNVEEDQKSEGIPPLPESIGENVEEDQKLEGIPPIEAPAEEPAEEEPKSENIDPFQQSLEESVEDESPGEATDSVEPPAEEQDESQDDEPSQEEPQDEDSQKSDPESTATGIILDDSGEAVDMVTLNNLLKKYSDHHRKVSHEFDQRIKELEEQIEEMKQKAVDERQHFTSDIGAFQATLAEIKEKNPEVADNDQQ